MNNNILNKISDNIKIVRDNISTAALRSGRNPEDIMLIAAAKTHPTEYVKAAIKAGVDAVGENRVQELLAKHSENAYAGAPLHFIGSYLSFWLLT